MNSTCILCSKQKPYLSSTSFAKLHLEDRPSFNCADMRPGHWQIKCAFVYSCEETADCESNRMGTLRGCVQTAELVSVIKRKGQHGQQTLTRKLSETGPGRRQVRTNAPERDFSISTAGAIIHQSQLAAACGRPRRPNLKDLKAGNVKRPARVRWHLLKAGWQRNNTWNVSRTCWTYAQTAYWGLEGNSFFKAVPCDA